MKPTLLSFAITALQMGMTLISNFIRHSPQP